MSAGDAALLFSLMLTPKQRAHLTALAHHKKAIVLVGQRGITDGIVGETNRALTDHELIKVKMRGASELAANAAELARRTESELIAIRGNVVILYRPDPEEPRIPLPSD